MRFTPAKPPVPLDGRLGVSAPAPVARRETASFRAPYVVGAGIARPEGRAFFRTPYGVGGPRDSVLPHHRAPEGCRSFEQALGGGSKSGRSARQPKIRRR